MTYRSRHSRRPGTRTPMTKGLSYDGPRPPRASSRAWRGPDTLPRWDAALQGVQRHTDARVARRDAPAQGRTAGNTDTRTAPPPPALPRAVLAVQGTE